MKGKALCEQICSTQMSFCCVRPQIPWWQIKKLPQQERQTFHAFLCEYGGSILEHSKVCEMRESKKKFFIPLMTRRPFFISSQTNLLIRNSIYMQRIRIDVRSARMKRGLIVCVGVFRVYILTDRACFPEADEQKRWRQNFRGSAENEGLLRRNHLIDGCDPKFGTQCACGLYFLW